MKDDREGQQEDLTHEQMDTVRQGDDHLIMIDDDDAPLINDVWTWESDLGSWIVAMQRAGIDRETIAEVLKRQKRVKLSPQNATRIYHEFMEEASK